MYWPAAMHRTRCCRAVIHSCKGFSLCAEEAISFCESPSSEFLTDSGDAPGQTVTGHLCKAGEVSLAHDCQHGGCLPIQRCQRVPLHRLET